VAAGVVAAVAGQSTEYDDRPAGARRRDGLDELDDIASICGRTCEPRGSAAHADSLAVPAGPAVARPASGAPVALAWAPHTDPDRKGRPIEVHNKVVAISGASSGIGAATAVLLAEGGAKLVLGARRLDRLEEIVARITMSGGEAACLRTDVRRRQDLSDLVAHACERYGRLDVLVNNAGIGPISPLDDLRVDEWDQMIDVNLRGVLYGIAAALPVFRRQGAGHFINLASTAAHRIVANQSVYAATKTAVRVLSEALRQEAGDSLRVTVISPGFTKTEFADDVTNPEIHAQIAEGKARFAMPPAAVARAIAFAISQPPEIDVGEIIVRPTAQG
jgi:NADP-dependent 3-hydroxy acid dehydrogenase YdfG